MGSNNTSISIIDGHAHLHEIDNVGAAIARAVSAGVSRVIAVGMELESNRKTMGIASRFFQHVYPAIGYHPWSILEEDIEVNLEYIRRHLEGCVALGEVGLDYKVKVKKGIQREVFSRVLALAKSLDKPVIIHTRFSEKRALRMVVQAGIRKAVFHWYSGPADILADILKHNYFISATPALAYSPRHREAMKQAPADRILIETDCPVKYQFEESEPATLMKTLGLLSEIKKISEAETARITTENTENFFGLD